MSGDGIGGAREYCKDPKCECHTVKTTMTPQTTLKTDEEELRSKLFGIIKKAREQNWKNGGVLVYDTIDLEEEMNYLLNALFFSQRKSQRQKDLEVLRAAVEGLRDEVRHDSEWYTAIDSVLKLLTKED